jgi:hypothetical protein
MENFPPNSRKAGEAARNPKRVEQVTSASAVRRRKPLGRQFIHTFFGGDARTASQYAWLNVVIPSAKDILAETVHAVIDRMVYGDAGRRRGYAPPTSGPGGYVQYHRMSQPMGQRQPPGPQSHYPPQQSRARQNFDEIIIPSRAEAEEVLDRLFDLLSQYEVALVSDLYELTGIKSSHTDHKWGWTDLRGAGVGRVRGGGYLLELPQPEFLS